MFMDVYEENFGLWFNYGLNLKFMGFTNIHITCIFGHHFLQRFSPKLVPGCQLLGASLRIPCHVSHGPSNFLRILGISW
jgi:hypothetical protein